MAGVVSEVTSRPIPPGTAGHAVSFHYICGGEAATECDITVEILQRTAASTSKQIVWQTQASNHLNTT